MVRFLSRRYAHVHDLLGRLIGSGSADFFADACKIEEERTLGTSRHLVGHLLREVEGAIIDTLVVTSEVAQALAKGSESKEEQAIAESAACVRCGEPCRKCKDSYSKKIKAILRAPFLENDENAAKWSSFVSDGWHWEAHRRNVWSPRRLDTDFEEKFERFVDILEAVLRAVERNYPNGVLGGIDSIIAAGPEKIDSLMSFLGTGATASRHIFGQLDPQWLPSLRKRRAFSYPPELANETDQSESYPEWPQADYLVRMAAISPEVGKIVADIIVDHIPRTTNQFIHQMLLIAATKMPSPDAARVARHEAEWLKANRWINAGLPNTVCNLTFHLLTNRQVEAAVDLLRASLSFIFPKTGDASNGSAEPRIPTFDYDHMVHRTIPELVKVTPSLGRMLLKELVLDVLLAGPSHHRRAIEQSQAWGFGYPLDSLLDELRDCYMAEVQSGNLDLTWAVQELEEPNQPILGRLALHLLRLYGDKAPMLVVERATDQGRLDSVEEEFHELREMIAAQFPKLDVTDQSRVIEAFRENATPAHLFSRFGFAPIDIEAYSRLQFRDLLAVVVTDLPPAVEAEYAALRREHGEREHPTYQSWADDSPRIGPNSPKGHDELLAMTDENLIAYVQRWVPESDDRFEPSREGLARQIQRCATTDPYRLSLLARRFRTVEPTYVGALFSGLHEAARAILSRQNGNPANTEESDSPPLINWPSVICLGDWAIGQIRAAAAHADILRTWGWVRSALLDIAIDAVLSASIQSRFKIGTWAWGIVKVLLDDPDPTPERVRNTKNDDVSFSINTVRGLASEVAIQMAHSLSKSDSLGQTLAKEILIELERRTDSEVEPSAAIRKATARWMNHLFDTHVDTAGRIADRLFVKDGACGPDECGAWKIFLHSNQAWRPAFEVLRSHYARAVARASDDDIKSVQDLGRHVVWLAAWGIIGPGSTGGILDSFIRNAPAAARKIALGDLGRALYRGQEDVAAESVARLITIWEHWVGISSSRAEEEREDIAAFGWWFACPTFDPDWALPELSRVLTTTGGQVEMHIEVVSKLAKIASMYSDDVAGCIEKFIEQPEQWRVKACKDSLRSAITALNQSPAVRRAQGIVSTLVARGWMDFRDLALLD